MAKEKESWDIRLAEWAKRLDIVQILGGIVLLPFFPALGTGIIIYSTGTFIAAEVYQRKRRQKQAQLSTA